MELRSAFPGALQSPWPHRPSPDRDWCLLLTPLISLVYGIQFFEQNRTATLWFWIPSWNSFWFLRQNRMSQSHHAVASWLIGPASAQSQRLWGSALSARPELLWQNNCIHPPSLPRRVLILHPLLTCTCVCLLPFSQFISLRLQPGEFCKRDVQQFPYPGGGMNETCFRQLQCLM